MPKVLTDVKGVDFLKFINLVLDKIARIEEDMDNLCLFAVETDLCNLKSTVLIERSRLLENN